MRLSRDIALKIHWVFDQLVPPILRDMKWFMFIPLTICFRQKAPLFMKFKEEAYKLTDEEYKYYYRETGKVSFERDSDLNQKSIELIKQNIVGKKLLEVGCGKGYLSNMIAEDSNIDITAVDILIDRKKLKDTKNLKFIEANVLNLPFADKAFDTVICTHTLEHVIHLQNAIEELRRVANRLVIVTPRQRPYKYTFDLHINFFPYLNSFLLVMGKEGKNVICIDADGDIFYTEDVA